MTHQLFQLPKQTSISSNLTLLAGAKAYFYATGTTTTPQDTYSDSALTTPHTNPVVADSAGVLPPIYLDPSKIYKLVLKTSADVELYQADPCNDQILSQAVIGAILYPRTSAEQSAGVTPKNYAYPTLHAYRYWDGVASDHTQVIRDLFNSAVTGDVLFLGNKSWECNGTITVTGKSSLHIVGDSTQYLATNGSIHFNFTGSFLIGFDLSDCSDWVWKDCTVRGAGASVVGSYLIQATDVTGDIDMSCFDCDLGSVETVIQCEGRGFTWVGGTCPSVLNLLEITWPNPYTEGANDDQKDETGMRAYRLENLRLHGWAGGWCIINEGANAANFQGAVIRNIYSDSNLRIFKGYMRKTQISDWKAINLNNANYLFDTQATYHSSICDCSFEGMYDNGSGGTRQFGRIGIFRGIDGFTIDNVHVARVINDVIDLVDGNNITINGLVMKDVCRDNGTGTWYPIKMTGVLNNISIDHVHLSTDSMTNNTRIVDTALGTVTNLRIGPHIFYDSAEWYLTDYQTLNGWTLLGTIADDAAVNVDLPGQRLCGRVSVMCSSATTPRFAQACYRWDGAAVGIDGIGGTAGGGSQFEFTTGALTGTTGTDTKITVSVHTNGKLYVENRNGGSRLLYYRFED